MSPIGPNEVERMSAANGYTRSLGGIETPGLLVVARIPDMNVPVCVVKSMSGAGVSKGVRSMSVMACVSACEELVRGPTQTVDRFIVEIAPAPQNVTSKVRSSFSERPG